MMACLWAAADCRHSPAAAGACSSEFGDEVNHLLHQKVFGEPLGDGTTAAKLLAEEAVYAVYQARNRVAVIPVA